MRGSSISILILLALLILVFIGLGRLADIAADHFSKHLQVGVSIDALTPHLSRIVVREFEMGNPSGYSLPKAFEAKTITIHAPLTAYIKDDIVIEEIDLDTISLGLEFDSTSGARGNWTVLMENLKSSNVDGPSPRTILIKKAVFTNIQAQLLFRKGGGAMRTLPTIDRIELTNISTKGQFPVDQLTASVLGEMVKAVFAEYQLNNMLSEIFIKPPEKAVETLTKPFEKIFQ